MFLVRLTQFEPLLDATSLLAQISNNVDVKFTQFYFYLIVSHHRCPRFVATLQLSQRFFTNFSADDHDHSFNASLESFHDAMLDGGNFSSMTIHLLDKTNKLILRFETSSQFPPLHHELTLSPPHLAENYIGQQLDLGKYFIVKSKEFRRIIKELPIFQDNSVVSVGATKSRIKFSIASKEITLPKGGPHCKMVGFEEEVETQFQIILHPMLFFLDFTHKSNKIWFFKTKNNSHSVMSVPAYGFVGQYLIYFPSL